MADFAEKVWYLWPCSSYSGAFNMAVDDFLVHQTGKLLDRPLLRFYTWQPYCISLGYHQNIEDVDVARCQQEGIQVVRRPTGGRAVLHAEELTYSVVYPIRDVQVEEFYRLVHLPFVRALRELGVPAEFQQAQADFRTFYKTDSAPVCFATSARYEVEIEGRKLIGSAQRVYERAILQHGSLLLGQAHEHLVDLLHLPEAKRRAMREYMREHTATVWQYRPGVSPEHLADKVTRAFQELYGIRFIPYQQHSALQKALEALREGDGGELGG